MATILIEKGRGKGKAISLKDKERLSFGRDASCDVCFEDGLASRQHFAIERKDGAFSVIDLGSRNGTFLNGDRVTELRLTLGDLIAVGDTIFSFLEDDEAAARGGLVGETLAGYQLEERIGRGGMGIVYRASQLSLGRTVALKVLSSRLTREPALVSRFVQEARAAGKLAHPCIVRVDDVGEDRGLYYISMEYLAGGSMEDLLNHTDRILPVGALAMMKDVAKGLQYAESQGIVHRDIKPDNLMLDDDGRVKICDLGIAISLEASAQSAGSVIGTPHYMSPEQAMAKPVDHRSDIYSLGCTFYRMLAGRMPFTGVTHKEITRKQIRYQPPALHTFIEEVSPRLSRLVEWMMAKNPDARPQDATELLAELEACLAAETAADRSEEELLEQSPEIQNHLSARIGTTIRRRRRTTLRYRRPRAGRLALRLAASFLLVAALTGLAVKQWPALTAAFSESSGTAAGSLEDPAAEEEASNEFLAARSYEKAHPDESDACLERYQAVTSRFPGTAAARSARIAGERLQRREKLLAIREKRWTRTLELSQRLIDAHRFGGAVKLLETFARNYPGSEHAELADSCVRKVYELAGQAYRKQADVALEYRTSGDPGAAALIYENISSEWGLEPFASDAKAQLAALDKQ